MAEARGRRRDPVWRVGLPTDSPFHLEATVRLLQRRPGNPVDLWDGRHYRRLLVASGGPTFIEVHDRGTIDAPALRLRAWPAPAGVQARSELLRAVRRLLGLDVNPAPLQRCAGQEPRLRDVAPALRGMRPPCYPELLEAFTNVIAFQQISLDAGIAAITRLVHRFGATLEVQGRRYHAFPAAHAIARARTASLRACGLSRQKAQALRAIAQAIAGGRLDAAQLAGLDSQRALERLRTLPGIGAWSAALVLLRGQGRLDVFPPGDVGAIGSLTALMQLRSPAALRRIEQRFGACRGYLYFFGLAGRLLAAQLIRPAPAAAPAAVRARVSRARS